MLIIDNSLVQLLRAGFLPKFCVRVLKKPSTVVESMLMLCAGRPILLNCFFCLILQYSLEVTREGDFLQIQSPVCFTVIWLFVLVDFLILV